MSGTTNTGDERLLHPQFTTAGDKGIQVDSIPINHPLEDERVFGKDVWVYCNQHLAGHLTGWCSVSVRNKVSLGIIGNTNKAAKEAYSKCKAFGFKLFEDGK